jgi:hypothetical protein
MARTPLRDKQGQQYNEAETIRRRDEAVRRALNTPPKPYKDSKVGKAKPRSPRSSDKG